MEKVNAKELNDIIWIRYPVAELRKKQIYREINNKIRQ